MKRCVILSVVAALILSFAGAALAAGTPDDAKAMVEKSLAFYKANGKDKTFAEVNNPKGQFVKEDIYVFIFDMAGVCVAHGANPKLIGKNMMDSKDADGKEFVKEFYKVPAAGGWVGYKWTNPETKKIQDKVSWIVIHDNLLFGSGAYK
ncbi:MAG: cache domain-containing protein [Thermodesulfobacteriota bacterium]